MSFMGFIGALVMIVVLLVFVVGPLIFNPYESTQSFRNKQRERALAYYERVLTNIRDLDDDLATGKISEDEYTIEREKWMARGVELLAMIAELDKQANIMEDLDDQASEADIDHAIEQAISEMREQQQVTEVS